MEEKKRLYEIIKLLSIENLELYKRLKKYESDEEELIKCDNCGEMVPEDYICKRDALNGDGNICLQCIENGYGE